MAISLREGRGSKRRNRRDQTRPSVREVCLLGVSGRVAEGDRLTWSGRTYRVEATHAPYAHLTPAPDEAGRG